MTLRYLRRPLLLFVTLSSFPVLAQPATTTVFYLRQSGADVVVDSITLKQGEMQVLSERDVLGVVLPFGSGGMSGDVVQAAQRTGMIAVRFQEGEIRVKVRRADESERDLPAVKVATLAGLDIRINITGGAGLRKAYMIRGYRDVSPAPGPVLDMFGGVVPLAAGDFSITTEVRAVEAVKLVEGSAALEFDDGLLFVWGEIAGAAPGWFIVDFGAGATVIDSRMLPPGAEVHALQAVEHSASGTRDVGAVMHGAGGAVTGFLGQAVLPELRMGSLEFLAARVSVVKALPAFGRPIAGILGMDLLGRASAASLTLTEPRRLTLVAGSSPHSADAIAVPFSIAAKHLFVEGSVEGTPVRLLFDTGARRTLIAQAIADKAGLGIDRERVWQVRGLDGNRLDLPSAVPKRFAIGSLDLRGQRIYVGELPALRAMGLQDTGGLLGTDVLARFARIDVDFGAGLIRFHAPPH